MNTSKQRCESILILFLCCCFLQNKNLPIENTTDCLSTMATVCKVMLETPWVTSCVVRSAAVLALYIHVCIPRVVVLSGNTAADSPVRRRCLSACGWWSGSSSFTTTCILSGLSQSHPKSTWVQSHRLHYLHFTAGYVRLTACFLSTDERLHQSPQRSAAEQCRRPPQRSQVSSCWNRFVVLPRQPSM